MKVVRWVLGQLILLLNFIFTPRSKKRAPEQQAQAEAQLQGLALYQYKACPFCVKVRRALKRQGVSVPLMDAKADAAAREALMQGGGKLKVPCLHIQDEAGERWLYESNDIIAFIDQRLAAVDA